MSEKWCSLTYSFNCCTLLKFLKPMACSLIQGNGNFPAEYSGKVSEKEKQLYRATRGQNLIECHLDPHHTHFVLVDDGSEGQFGKEMAIRGEMEAEICKNEVSRLKGIVFFFARGSCYNRLCYNRIKSHLIWFPWIGNYQWN